MMNTRWQNYTVVKLQSTFILDIIIPFASSMKVNIVFVKLKPHWDYCVLTCHRNMYILADMRLHSRITR